MPCCFANLEQISPAREQRQLNGLSHGSQPRDTDPDPIGHGSHLRSASRLIR